jgi:hypothetical protein
VVKLTLKGADGCYDCVVVRREIVAPALPAKPAPENGGNCRASTRDAAFGAIQVTSSGKRRFAKHALEAVREDSDSHDMLEDIDEPLLQEESLDDQTIPSDGDLNLQTKPKDRAKLGAAVRQLGKVPHIPSPTLP